MKTTEEPKRLSWKPKRNGDRYCAPACGRGCTIQEYRNAHARANALVKRMNRHSQGWTTAIHENLGWHYRIELILGPGDWLGEFTLKLYEHKGSVGSARYTTLLGTAGGEPRFTPEGNFKTPEAAANAQIKVFQEFARLTAEQATNLDNAIKQARAK